MNVQELQATLRRFAAERNWQPFHTPKNLATALMVEAAELAEIFQWMTEAQSCKAHDDPATAQRIGEELADVLLYLLQVADHTRTDLQRAVAQKLALNARKYPAAPRIDVTPAAEDQTPTTHVLLDYENVQPTEQELRTLVPDATKVWVFHGPHQKGVEQRFSSFGDSVTAVPISKSGKNALDFHLSFYMGYLASRNQKARIVVVANDKGYEPMLMHAASMGFDARRVTHNPPGVTGRARTAPAAKKATKAPAAGKTTGGKKTVAPPKPTPAKSTPVKKTVAKKVAAKQTAAKHTPAKQTPAKKAAAKTPPIKKTGTAGARKAPVTTTPKEAFTVSEALSKRTIDGLRKMGVKRPHKMASLRRALKPLLGVVASEDAITALLNHLIPRGVVALEPDGSVIYPQFSGA